MLFRPIVLATFSSILAFGVGFNNLAVAIPKNKNYQLKQLGRQVPIPAKIIASAVEYAANGSKISLNNYGNRYGKSWHKANDSYIQTASVLGSDTQRFDIPELIKDLDCGRWCPDMGDGKFYINDWNANNVSVKWQNPYFKISLLFESNGREIKGFHTGSFKTLGDGGMPDVNIDNARLDIYVKPVATNGGLSYRVMNTDFKADIQATGTCRVSRVDVCNTVFDYKNQIVSEVQNKVTALLNNQSMRVSVAEVIQPVFNNIGANNITKVSTSGDFLVVHYE